MSNVKHLSVYCAGALFSHRELIGNAIVARYIDKISHGRFCCVLPQDLEQTDVRAVQIRNQDIVRVVEADACIFNFDGTELDSGTVVEMMIAKMLDIPSVIVRSDFRPGGDSNVPGGDNWNLMCSSYPRSKTFTFNSMVWYQEALKEGGSAHDIEKRLYTRIAEGIIAGLEAAIAEKPVMEANKDKTEMLYDWALRFPGNGIETAHTPEEIERIIQRNIADGVLPAMPGLAPEATARRKSCPARRRRADGKKHS